MRGRPRSSARSGLEEVAEVLRRWEPIDPHGTGAACTSVTRSPSRSGRGPRRPTAAAAGRRAAGGRIRLHGREHLADEPSGVQLSSPIARRAADPDQLVGHLLVMGANITPTQEITASNSPSANGSASASASPHSRRRPPRPPRGAVLEQLGRQVGRHHAGADQRRRDGRVAVACRDVEHPLAGPHPPPWTSGTELRDHLAGHRRVVAERPHRAVPGLQRLVGGERVGIGAGVAAGLAGWAILGRVGHGSPSPRCRCPNARGGSGAQIVLNVYSAGRSGSILVRRGEPWPATVSPSTGQYCPITKGARRHRGALVAPHRPRHDRRDQPVQRPRAGAAGRLGEPAEQTAAAPGERRHRHAQRLLATC